MSKRLSLSTLTLAGVLAIGHAAPTLAAPLDLGYSLTYNGTATVLTGAGAINPLSIGSSSTYGHTFTSKTPIIPATVGLSTSAPAGFGFYDDFLFTIPSASTNAVTSTIGLSNILGIDNLQVRVYNAATNAPLPVLGTPNGTVLEGWTTLAGPGTLISILSPANLHAGTYVLEVRGTVIGTAGGSYSGVMNVAPVPLPAGLWLFGSALGALGAARRRS